MLESLPRLFGKPPADRADAERLAAAFRAFAEPNRMQILALLAKHGELTQTDVLAGTPLTQPTTAHHLRLLVEAGLVSRRKEGTWVHYRLEHRALVEMANAIRPGPARTEHARSVS